MRQNKYRVVSSLIHMFEKNDRFFIVILHKKNKIIE